MGIFSTCPVEKQHVQIYSSDLFCCGRSGLRPRLMPTIPPTDMELMLSELMPTELTPTPPLFPSAPAPDWTPSPRDSMPSPRALPSPPTVISSARGPLMPMLMLTTPTPMPVTLPTPMELLLTVLMPTELTPTPPLFPSAPAPDWTPSPRDSMP